MLLSNIPLCENATVCLSISWWAFGLLPIFFLLWIMLLWTFLNKFLCHHVCSFISSWYIIRDRIARSYDNCVLFLKNYQTVSKVSIYFISSAFYFFILYCWHLFSCTVSNYYSLGYSHPYIFGLCPLLHLWGFFCFVYFPLRVPVLLGPTVQLILWDFLLIWIHTPTSWTPCPCIIEFLPSVISWHKL